MGIPPVHPARTLASVKMSGHFQSWDSTEDDSVSYLPVYTAHLYLYLYIKVK